MSPMVFAISSALNVLLLIIIGFSIFGWSRAIARWRHGEPVIANPQPRVVSWGFVDLFCLLVLYVNLQIDADILLVRFRLVDLKSEMGRQIALLSTLCLANLSWIPLALVGEKLIRRVSWRQLGCVPSQFMNDVRLGGIAFCMLAPPIYGLQYLFVQWWPSKHPIVEMIRENPDPIFLILGGVATCLAAPLFEECAFRLFLQGWFQNIAQLYRRPKNADLLRLNREYAFRRALRGFPIGQNPDDASRPTEEPATEPARDPHAKARK